ncbi:unnamed protein product [Paramecium octaurelia]|uniref:Uncharacterized protein n=1 Tax=Paramecium octaurelia TaxID=43137 RepID=A0A8S1W7Y1_PAROT|nr:unnamed protein product [Paramecium octaurelia]
MIKENSYLGQGKSSLILLSNWKYNYQNQCKQLIDKLYQFIIYNLTTIIEATIIRKLLRTLNKILFEEVLHYKFMVQIVPESLKTRQTTCNLQKFNHNSE